MTPELGPASEPPRARFTRAARRAGVKVTPQRLEIFAEVASRTDHPDAEGVFRAVRERLPAVSLDTVYRTLWLLTDLGLITTLGTRRESVRFDAGTSLHHHYVCTACGLTQDFESPALDAIPLPESVAAFGVPARTQVEVLGLCAACHAESA
jgi:Fur family transcriptional regulator, peroxide stress response regulator